MRVTGKIPFTNFYYDIRFRKAIGKVISYNSTVYANTEYGDYLGDVLMFDIDTDTLGGCSTIYKRLSLLCCAFDLNGYLFKTDNGFHFVTTNIIGIKDKIISMFDFIYPMIDDKAFAFGIINEEWHLRLSKKPNGKPIRYLECWLYGNPNDYNSKAHYELLDKLAGYTITNPLPLPKGKLIETDFEFTTYPLWK